MKIGIDATPLQNPHALRGIGSVVRNIIKHMPSSKQAEFIFYVNDIVSAKETISGLIPEGVSYSFQKHPGNRLQVSTENRPGESILRKVLRKLKHLLSLFQKQLPLPEGSSLDTYIQFDPNILLPSLPKKTAVRLFIHDLIPYVLEKDYLWSYQTARNQGLSRKAGLNRHFLRLSYVHTLKKNCRRATKILANSQHTKDDLVAHLGVEKEKISVTYLGVRKPANITSLEPPKYHYSHSDWGTVKREFTVPKSMPFLFFTGGVDPRRKLKDLFAAYNNLRARGIEVALLLAGDTMVGLKNLPQKEARKYLLENQSYSENIYFLGHVSQSNLEWLYANATAFVFPSTYEGFGLPLLEATVHGTPVITYWNSSLKELRNDSIVYAKDYLDIADQAAKIIQGTSKSSRVIPDDRLLKKYNWATIAKKII